MKEFIHENTSTACSAEEFLRYLSFSDSQIADDETATIYQSENEEWFLHKVGFAIVSKQFLLHRSNKNECEPNYPREAEIGDC